MSVSKAVEANAYKNNGGTVVLGGNIAADGAITNAPGKSFLGVGQIKASVPTRNAEKVNDSGNWATLTEQKYVMVGGNVTTQLAGVSNTALAKPANKGDKHDIHLKESRRTIHITSWNYVTGAATKGEDTNDSFGTDDAANPTQDTPGELTHMTGAKNPTNADYPARTQW